MPNVFHRIETIGLYDPSTMIVRVNYCLVLAGKETNDAAQLSITIPTAATSMRMNETVRQALSDYVNTAYGLTTTIADMVSFSARGNIEHVTVNFGTGIPCEDTTVTTTVNAPWVTAQSKITCYPSATGTADHEADEAAVEGVSAYAVNLVPGVGFDILTWTPQGTWGTYLIEAVGA